MGPKPGWKSTEFWMSALGSLAAILGAFAGILPAEYAGIDVAVSGGLYTVSRGLAKSRPAVMRPPGV